MELSYVEYVIALEEFAKLDGAVALSMLAHNSLCIGHILQYGHEQQKYLPKLASGKWIGAWALTEPQAGSDIRGIRTTAKAIGNIWLILCRKKYNPAYKPFKAQNSPSSKRSPQISTTLRGPSPPLGLGSA